MSNSPFQDVKAGVESVAAEASKLAPVVKADVAKVAAVASTIKADVSKASADAVAVDNAMVAYVKANPKKIVAAVVSLVGSAAAHFVWKLF